MKSFIKHASGNVVLGGRLISTYQAMIYINYMVVLSSICTAINWAAWGWEDLDRASCCQITSRRLTNIFM